MDCHNSKVEHLADNFAMLLRTGRFSDLTLLCQNQKFSVHRAVVCARSPVWAAATEGNFKEAEKKEIAVDIVDAFTLQRGLYYLYTDDYDDGDEPIPPNSVERAISNRLHQTNEELVEPEQTETDDADVPLRDTKFENQETTDSLPSPELETDPEDSGATAITERERPCNCLKFTADKTTTVCSNTKLQANANVYKFADYYQIPALKRMAADKFAIATENFCPKDFHEVCYLVYASVPSIAHELRSTLTGVIADNGHILVGEASFMNTALGLPELLRDYFANVAPQLQITINEKDAAVLESLEIGRELDAAKTSAEEDVRQLVERVNDWKRCRLCALESNIHFTEEARFADETTYVLRCKCRTRNL